MYQLKFGIYNTKEELIQLGEYVNEIEEYVPEELFEEFSSQYENAVRSSSDLLEEYLKIVED